MCGVWEERMRRGKVGEVVGVVEVGGVGGWNRQVLSKNRWKSEEGAVRRLEWAPT